MKLEDHGLLPNRAGHDTHRYQHVITLVIAVEGLLRQTNEWDDELETLTRDARRNIGIRARNRKVRAWRATHAALEAYYESRGRIGTDEAKEN